MCPHCSCTDYFSSPTAAAVAASPMSSLGQRLPKICIVIFFSKSRC
uniref:Uncharacterized protein n=1 Tax=Echinococcus granulosus TaxID=6210 RepID=A0A068WBN2_ECHGR|nr:hypothetical protein EgrG_000749200 [Echinococcus granulosus]